MKEQVYSSVSFSAEYWAQMELIFERVLERREISILKPQSSGEELLCKIDEIAKDLNVTRQTVHEWKRKGLIPYERMGGRVYFRKSQVRDALKKINDLYNYNR